MVRVWLWVTLCAVSAAGLVITFHKVRSETVAPLPPPLAQVGPWSLTGHDGRSFGSQDVEGTVWVANFFFSRCPTICPKLMRDMTLLQQSLAEMSGVALVSFTVDPDHDTPQELDQYRVKLLQKHPVPEGIDEGSLPPWTFVTGTRAQLLDVAQRMKLHLGEKRPLPSNPNLYDIGHVAQFILFDQQGNLRGLFPTDEKGRAAVKKWIRQLEKQRNLPAG